MGLLNVGYITLRELSEDSDWQNLIDYINKILHKYNLTNSEILFLLKNGSFLFLFDGLDEVSENKVSKILQSITSFADSFFTSEIFESDRKTYIAEREKLLKDITKTNDKIDNKIEKLKDEISDLENKISILEEKILKSKKKDRQELKKLKQEKKETKQKIIELENLIIPLQNDKRSLNNKIKHYPDISKIYDRGLSLLSKKNPDKLYYNHFVITCRIAAQDYNFEKFVEVEVADFNNDQIRTFTENWFTNNPKKKKNFIKAKNFIDKLSQNKSVKELATNPLLLTLLCLVFEESNNFPESRADLYKEGIYILLRKWDSERNIDRQQVYKNLSTGRKEDLLSHIAFNTFEHQSYFFKQSSLEKIISDYIKNLAEAKIDPETLRIDSIQVLKSIEAHHGLLIERAKNIYSFSHLTFQEYFTARKFVYSSSIKLQDLSSHITEKRWREVFLLAVDLMPEADELIKCMKRKIDSLLVKDKTLQKIIQWVKLNSSTIQIQYKQSVIRAFYFSIAYSIANINGYKNKDA